MLCYVDDPQREEHIQIACFVCKDSVVKPNLYTFLLDELGPNIEGPMVGRPSTIAASLLLFIKKSNRFIQQHARPPLPCRCSLSKAPTRDVSAIQASRFQSLDGNTARRRPGSRLASGAHAGRALRIDSVVLSKDCPEEESSPKTMEKVHGWRVSLFRYTTQKQFITKNYLAIALALVVQLDHWSGYVVDQWVHPHLLGFLPGPQLIPNPN